MAESSNPKILFEITAAHFESTGRFLGLAIKFAKC